MITRICPLCKEGAEINIACLFFDFSWARFDIPYFTCNHCKIIFMDRQLIRELIQPKREGRRTPNKKVIYKKIIDEMMEIFTQRPFRIVTRYRKPPN